MYTERLKAILTEVFGRYMNVYPEYNRCILLKHPNPYYGVPKLWNMLENKFKNVTNDKLEFS